MLDYLDCLFPLPDDYWDEYFNPHVSKLFICRCRSGSWFISAAPEDHIAKNRFIVWYGPYVDM